MGLCVSDEQTAEQANSANLVDPGFVHLRVHSAYSLSEGAVRIKPLPGLCKEREFPAIAITDTGNMFGALEVSETLSGAGIQPIPGLTINLGQQNAQSDDAAIVKVAGNGAGTGHPRGGNRLMGQIVLLAQSEVGYQNLLHIVSHAYLAGPDELDPFITIEELRNWSDGVICLTGGALGPLGTLLQDNRAAAAEDLLLSFKDLFGDRLYMELQRHGMAAEVATEDEMLRLAYDHDVALVATNDVFFPDAEMYEAHDALLCIAAGAYVDQSDRRQLTPEHYLKTAREMKSLFNDLPEAVQNSVEIAKRCAYRPHTRAPILPKFAEGDEADELRRQASEGLEARLAVIETDIPHQDYRDRLDFELNVISNMGFPGYFLIVSDFIKWAKAHDIPVGPGRGSGAASVVAWSLTITDLDPLRFSLLFERFLNPERVSMPDFDIDFCQDRRDEVIAYVQDKYGADKVAQIITFGKLQARAVLRDVGRVLQMPYMQVDRLTKLVPNNPANPMTLQEAIDFEPKLKQQAQQEEAVDRLLKIGLQLEGLYRHASTHAAGVVIGDRPLDELVPVYRDPRSPMSVTQFNMKWVEPAGLVKFDFLGLKTLTVIQRAVNLLKERDIEVDMGHVPLDDRPSYELMARGDSIGVFQLESSGMRDVLRRMKPDVFEDVIALVALYRPGPMDNIPKFINTKQGLEEPNYHHPMLEDLLKETYGVIVYQEQVMQIAQVLAGYSLGEADLLRRAMGKKIKEEMDRQKKRFVDGAVEKGVDKQQAADIFELVDKFAGYGFNKAHAAAYAFVAYQTAWLKANYPVEFMAALMCYDMNNTDKLGIFRQESARMGIEVVPPCVNQSGGDFTVKDGRIHYALGAIKNVGRGAMDAVADERLANGPYKDLFDFAGRMDPKLFNKRMFENLARAGAFDNLNPNRQQVFASAEVLMAYCTNAASERNSNQNSLFGGDLAEELSRPNLKDVTDWVPMERLAQEFGAVGFFLSGHPLDGYLPALKRGGVKLFTDVQAAVAQGRGAWAGRVGGTVTVLQERKSQKSGKPFAFVKLTDPTGEYEVTVFSEHLRDHRDLLEPGQSVVLSVQVESQEDALRFTVNSVQSIEQLAANTAQGLEIFVQDAQAVPQIKELLPRAGKGRIKLIIPAPDETEAVITLPGGYAVTPKTSGAIMTIKGVSHVIDV